MGTWPKILRVSNFKKKEKIRGQRIRRRIRNTYTYRAVKFFKTEKKERTFVLSLFFSGINPQWGESSPSACPYP